MASGSQPSRGDPPPGGLVVCPTPIGHPDDLTARAAAALRAADLVACEDTRRTGMLLAQLGASPQLVSLHEHNERERIGTVLERLHAGDTVVLVSDAGTPVISDPGYPLVRAVVDAGLPLTVLPGASSVLVAVIASALPLDGWRFVGFLPRKPAALAAVLGATEPLVAFESPRRLARTLAVLAEQHSARPVAVCRELTKVHEEIVRGTAEEVARHFAEHEALGEIVLVGGRVPASPAGERGAEAVEALVEAGARPRPAAKVVAGLLGGHANEVYDAWLRRRRA